MKRSIRALAPPPLLVVARCFLVSHLVAVCLFLAFGPHAHAQALSGPGCGGAVTCPSLSVAPQSLTYTAGSGGNYATVTAVLAALNPQVLQPGGFVNINVLDGGTTEPAALFLTSAFGKQIYIQGQHTYPLTLSSVQSSSGSAGAWTYVLNVNTVANVAVGSYVAIYGVSGGTNPTYLAGAWPVTVVDAVNTRITITTTGLQAAAASGAVVGTVIDLPAVVKFAGTDGADIWSGATGINLDNLAIVGNGTAGTNGISLQDGDRVYIPNLLAVAKFGANNVLSLYPSDLNGSGYLIASSSGGKGMTASNGGTIDSPHIISTGNAGDGVYPQVAGQITWGVDAVFSGNGGAGGHAQNMGVLNGATTFATGNVGKGIDSGNGGFVSVGTLTSANNGAADQLQLNFGAGYSTTGCVGIGINVIPTAACLQTTSAKLTSGLLMGGTAPTLTGTCTTGSQTGGLGAGKFTATCTAQTVIMTFGFTAPNGWACDAHDITTPADTLNQTAFSTTSCTLTGTTAASDSVTFKAVAF